MFPFRYNGVSYNTCTLDAADENKPWCSTLVDDNNNHVSGGGHYGDCGPKCPLPGRSKFAMQTWSIFVEFTKNKIESAFQSLRLRHRLIDINLI